MQRKHQVLIGVAVAIFVLAVFIYLAKPVLTLPTVTMAETSDVSAFRKQLNVGEMNVVVRSDGKVSFNADGQAVAQLNYHLGSVKNAADLAQQTLLPQTARNAVFLVPIFLPQLAWSVFVGSLSAYYTLPLEITIRFVQG